MSSSRTRSAPEGGLRTGTRPSLAGEFRLEEGGPERYWRVASPQWLTMGRRLFGGYTAALTLAAARRRSPHLWATSFQAVFLEPLLPGRLDFHVEIERSGRSTCVTRTTVLQDHRPALVSMIWFLEPTGFGMPRREPLSVAPPPGECRGVAWREGKHEFDAFFERRALDYPLARADFRDRRPVVELWMRATDGGHDEDGEGATLWQATDILMFDAHLLEATVEARDLRNLRGASLNLTVHWHDPTAAPGWRRLRTAAAVHGDLVSSTGELWSEDGTPVASSSQQGLVYAADEVPRPTPS